MTLAAGFRSYPDIFHVCACVRVCKLRHNSLDVALSGGGGVGVGGGGGGGGEGGGDGGSDGGGDGGESVGGGGGLQRVSSQLSNAGWWRMRSRFLLGRVQYRHGARVKWSRA